MTKTNHRRVVIVGAGYVGSSIAYALTVTNLAREIIFIDIDEQKAFGEAMDIQHGIPYMGVAMVRPGTYQDCRDSDLIVITAGRPRRVGETRLDMVNDNISIIRDVAGKIRPYYKHGPVLLVSNPVDILTYECDKLMGLPNGRVFGTGCILDSSRLVRKIAEYTGLKIEAVKCNIVGEHGDSQFPVWSRLAIAGQPMEEYCENVGLPWGDRQKDAIFSSVRNMGAEIIAAKGRTYYGIATCVCSIADAVLNQRLTIAPVTSPLQGEYGIEGAALSVPSIIGVNGVEHRLEEKWTDQERESLFMSAQKIKGVIQHIVSR